MLPLLLVVAFSVMGVPGVCPVAGTIMLSCMVSLHSRHSVWPRPSVVQLGACSFVPLKRMSGASSQAFLEIVMVTEEAI